ncbi:TIGR02449 family protein [Parendozoicomonas haliclonae]|uniref:Cell division protein ZapB n=1 Tax=Parendozoicomonas haliclonae TaxID=1960125 RepID=A0A1X7AGJ3_9GAMM|nr:TIGR02449 family protein [Parendozoicomonas haliclonae]SMA38959.1 hypothetical protein EHSB41UT_00950 [Parendozoicomonas haliclonae]
MEPSELNELSCKIEDLITLCERLRRENQRLRSSEQQWKQERAQLIDKNDAARIRVEAMIGRLKALEHEA